MQLSLNIFAALLFITFSQGFTTGACFNILKPNLS